MNLLKTRPRETGLTAGTMLARVRDEMDRVFDRWFDRPLHLSLHTNGETWMPALDVTDSEIEITVKAEVPGMAAKDVSVAITGNTLTLSGEKDETKEEKGESFYVSERRFGSFRRSVELPDGVDADKITAEQTNGVLTIRIPKLKTAKPKHIPVKSSI